MENIERTLDEIPEAARCPSLSTLELAGVAALLHNLYNGVENVLKQIVQAQGTPMPTGDSWHRDLLSLAADRHVISRETLDALKPYLAFRHFFSHAYALDLQAPLMEELVANARSVLRRFQKDLDEALAT
jgi:hypothetical protein